MSRYPLPTPARATRRWRTYVWSPASARLRFAEPTRNSSARDSSARDSSARDSSGPTLGGAQPDLTSGSGGPAEMDAYRLSRSREPKTSL